MPFQLDYTVASSSKSSIQDPPGYLAPQSAKELSRVQAPASDVVVKQQKKETELKLRRAWDMAFAPAKQLPMQAIMLYFSGSGIQIFSLGTIFMLLTSPIGALLNIMNAFEPFRPIPPSPPANSKTLAAPPKPSYAPLIMPMIAYTACQGLTLALGLYKCATMGILPTGTGDWLQFETRNEAPEWSAIRWNSLA